MTLEVIQEKNGEIRLVVEGKGEDEAFVLGQLSAELNRVTIPCNVNHCEPPCVKIMLRERPEGER